MSYYCCYVTNIPIILFSSILFYNKIVEMEFFSDLIGSMYGERLKTLRKESGLSQAQLAEKLGEPPSNISHWENMHALSVSLATRIIARYAA